MKPSFSMRTYLNGLLVAECVNDKFLYAPGVRTFKIAEPRLGLCTIVFTYRVPYSIGDIVTLRHEMPPKLINDMPRPGTIYDSRERITSIHNDGRCVMEGAGKGNANYEPCLEDYWMPIDAPIIHFRCRLSHIFPLSRLRNSAAFR